MTAYVTAALRTALERGDQDALSAVFSNVDLAAPKFHWEPAADHLEHSELRFLLDYWDSLRGASCAPHYNRIDAADMWMALGFIMLLDVLDDGADFRYRLYGSKIADRSGIDMTGKRLSEFAIHPMTRAFFVAGYQAVIARRLPLKTHHQHAPGISITSTTRLILPLCDSEGAIARILVGNIPGDWRAS